MITQEARNILEKLADHLAGQIGLELVAQGHNNTGSLIESVRINIVEVFNGVILEASTLDYGTYLDRGRRAGSMPPVDALKKWVKERGLASQEKEVNSIAWAIATAIKKQGSPTKGAYRYTKNGKRTNWIDEVLGANEKIIADHIEEAMVTEYELRFNNTLIDVQNLLNNG
jgi:hypothetical protein